MEIPLTCKRCKHKWKYKGKSEWYVVCPKCKTSMRIREKVLKEKNR